MTFRCESEQSVGAPEWKNKTTLRLKAYIQQHHLKYIKSEGKEGGWTRDYSRLNKAKHKTGNE